MWPFNRRVWSLTGLIALLVLVGPSGHAQSSSLPVVPGAQGFGMDTRAAYGGSVSPTVYRVTSLNDSGAGSLRAALEAAEPRVVIFETSGMIQLRAPIIVSSPYLTVAGQTAPSPGVTVKGSLFIRTHDVLLQHVRIRPGEDPTGSTCDNALEVYSSTDQYNIVFDHLSVSWAPHINIGISNNARPVDLTIWRSIVSEGLNSGLDASCPPGGTTYGVLVFTSTHNVSLMQSLLAHNYERNPYGVGDSWTYVANNIMYNFGTVASFFADAVQGQASIKATLVGNYYRRGPDTEADAWAIGSRYLRAGSQIYRSDNALDGTPPLMDFLVFGGDGIDPNVSTAPLSPSNYNPMPSSAVYDFVLAQAGARPADRDAVDARIISEVQNRSGSQINRESDVGGYPTLAVNRRALTIPANPHGVTTSRYTNLEVWLQASAASVETTQLRPVSPTSLRILPN